MTDAKQDAVPSEKIFISYRRDGGAELARLIRDTLIRLGFRDEDIFLDVDHPHGGHFPTALLQQLDSSNDVVAILSDDSIRRCGQDGDWVRMELAYAIRQGKNIVPVMPAGFGWPIEPLPEELASLPTFNGVNYSHEYFAACMGRLLKLLTTRPTRRLSRRAMIAGGVAVAGAGLAALGKFGCGTTAVDPLSLQWYAFGQRFRDGAWRDFRVQDGATLYDGDQFRVVLAPSADCHVCVLSFNADGQISQLFPNPAIQQRPLCRGGQNVEIPDGINWFTLDETTGTETIFLVASYDPLDDLPALVKKLDRQGASPESAKAVRERIAMVEKGNQPEQDGTLRTRSGVVVRNTTIAPDRRMARARLQSGQNVEGVMDVVQGRVALVQRIRFAHVHPKQKEHP